MFLAHLRVGPRPWRFAVRQWHYTAMMAARAQLRQRRSSMAQPTFLDRFLAKRLNGAGFASRVTAVPGRQLHVLVGEGTGQLPPIVLVHGISASAASYGPMMKILRQHFKQIIVPDLPGHGLSAPLLGDTGHEDLFAAAALSLRELISEPVFVFGNSMGGGFAMHWAEKHPELTLGLILCSPAGAPTQQADMQAFQASFRLDTLAKARIFAGKLTYRRMPALIAWLMAPIIKRGFASKTVLQILAQLRPDHGVTPEQLAKLTMPLLFLWGKAERLMPEAHFDYFAKHLPAHARIERPTTFGHCPQFDRPAEVAKYVVEFAAKA